jgi:mono/diheme cytochrome c family protein
MPATAGKGHAACGCPRLALPYPNGTIRITGSGATTLLHSPFRSTALAAALFVASTATAADTPAWVPDAAGYRSAVKPFLDSHCIECHGEKKPKGSFRADTLPNDFADPAVRAKWAEVVNVLNSHTMPPEGRKQPPAGEVAKAVDWITAQTVRAEEARRDRAPVLRRLTRDEYRNAIRDLTGVDFDVSGFPADPPAGGFDNNARALTVSPLHVELYAAAARQVLDRALVAGPRPEKILWRFDPKCVPDDSRRVKLDDKNPHVIVNGGNNREDGDWVVVHTDGWDRSVNARNFRVPTEGTYIVRLRAAARVPDRAAVVAAARKILEHRRDEQMQKNPKGAKYHEEQFQRDLEHFRTDGMYDYGPPRVKLVQHLGPQPRTVAEFDVDASPEKPGTYETRVRFTTESAGLNFHNVYHVPPVLENFWCQRHETFARPDLLVDWFEIEGPVVDDWPPVGHRAILFDSPLREKDERAYARAVLTRFMRRAYRRPVEDAEVDAKLALFDRWRKDQPFAEAIKLPLTAVLASPNFLFLAEAAGPGGKPRPLTDHELAARLSFFLWAAPPDEELSRLADAGKLRDPAELRRQTNRLLNDPRGNEFVRRFAGQWLGLGQVGANPPAADLFQHYDRHYETSMVAESEAFFAEVLRHDLDAFTLVKSDFVVINERLARAYGIPGVKGDHFRRVAVPPGVHRGGLPTQASILTITSNGTRTSPVKRGTWVLKTLLGADPGLPVADAGEIAAKVEGIERATVRKRLEIHRTRAQCARCHSHIDPFGFALENYDAAGMWREKEGFGYKGRVEKNDPPVDNTSRLADGTEVAGVEGLQQVVRERGDDFLRNLAGKLLTFALGREMGVADRPLVLAAVEHMKRNGRTLRSLVEFSVASEAFRSK